jgi:hypothetical protein
MGSEPWKRRHIAGFFIVGVITLVSDKGQAPQSSLSNVFYTSDSIWRRTTMDGSQKNWQLLMTSFTGPIGGRSQFIWQ